MVAGHELEVLIVYAKCALTLATVCHAITAQGSPGSILELSRSKVQHHCIVK
jgi:hypothetical protein